MWVVLLGAFAPLSAKLNSQKVDTSTSLLPEDSEAGRVAETLATRFAGGDKPTTVLLYRRAGGLTPEDQKLITENAQEAAKVPLAGTALPAFVDGKPAPQQVTKDGTTAFTVVPLAPGKSERVAESITELRALADDIPGLQFHVTGASALLNDINTAVESADVVLVLVTVLLVLVLLLAIYRSPLLALIPLFVVIVSYVVASGIVYLLAKDGLKVDSTSTSLLLILMFGAGTDYCLLLVARYKEDLQRIEDQTEALRHAIPRAAPAIIASGLTVAAALLTLVASELDTNQTLGPVTAIGVAIVLVASITLLPAILGLIGRRGFWPTAKQVAYDASLSHTEYELTEGRWLRFGRWVLARPKTALIGGVAVLLVCALGLFAWSPDPTPVKEFRTSPDSKQGYDEFAKRFPPGAVSPSTALVERPGGTASDADVATVVKTLQAVDGVFAVFPAPEPRSEDKRIARLGLVLDEDPLKPAALDRIDPLREAADGIGGGLRVQIGDGAARFHDQGVASERDLLVIAPLVLGVILIVLIVLLRALVAPLYLLATVVLSYLGTLGLSLLAFDVIFGRDGVDTLLPILAFIFLVALGVDYNIFLMSRVREEAALRGTQEGILRGIVSTGPVITSAGLILAGTFIVLTTLPVWLLFELGFTVALGVLIDTFLVRSAIVPAITSLLGDRAWWPSKPEAGGVVPAGSSPTIEVPALLGARKGVELLPAGLGARRRARRAGELRRRARRAPAARRGRVARALERARDERHPRPHARPARRARAPEPRGPRPRRRDRRPAAPPRPLPRRGRHLAAAPARHRPRAGDDARRAAGRGRRAARAGGRDDRRAAAAQARALALRARAPARAGRAGALAAHRHRGERPELGRRRARARPRRARGRGRRGGRRARRPRARGRQARRPRRARAARPGPRRARRRTACSSTQAAAWSSRTSAAPASAGARSTSSRSSARSSSTSRSSRSTTRA